MENKMNKKNILNGKLKNCVSTKLIK